MHLPKSVLGWTRPDQSKAVSTKTIFEYMDGAGELYIGYRFDRLDVYTYRAPDPNRNDDILVELYRMKTSDDAFGLLSLDWNGDPVELGDTVAPSSEAPAIPNVRFLYGAGLLRIWSDNLYARVMAFPETVESKEAVLQIGRAIVRCRKNAPAPVFLNVLPRALSGGWAVERNTVVFLRSHWVLNSIYFLSFSNILDLDLSCSIASAQYRLSTNGEKSRPLFLFIIRYPEPDKAKQSLVRFHKNYFSEISMEQNEGFSFLKPQVYFTENKWSGYMAYNRYAVLAFELPDRSTGETVLTEVVNHIQKTEGIHD